MIRDQALAASAACWSSKSAARRSSRYQPPGLWSELTGGDDYEPGTGADLLPPQPVHVLEADGPAAVAGRLRRADARDSAPSASRARTRRCRRSTLLNDPTYVEAARVLAERVMREAARRPTSASRRAMLLVVGRAADARRSSPSSTPASIATALVCRRTGRGGPAAGDRPVTARSRLDAGELAAYAAVCSTILNLDEAVTKE